MTRPPHLETYRKQCPECGTRKTIRERTGVRRLRPRRHACTECMFVGVLGRWDDGDPKPASPVEGGP